MFYLCSLILTLEFKQPVLDWKWIGCTSSSKIRRMVNIRGELVKIFTSEQYQGNRKKFSIFFYFQRIISKFAEDFYYGVLIRKMKTGIISCGTKSRVDNQWFSQFINPDFKFRLSILSWISFMNVIRWSPCMWQRKTGHKYYFIDSNLSSLLKPRDPQPLQIRRFKVAFPIVKTLIISNVAINRRTFKTTQLTGVLRPIDRRKWPLQTSASRLWRWITNARGLKGRESAVKRRPVRAGLDDEGQVIRRAFFQSRRNFYGQSRPVPYGGRPNLWTREGYVKMEGFREMWTRTVCRWISFCFIALYGV